MCVSLLGDGVFIVAMAWQVYALSNAPTALSLVGIAMTVPTIAFLLLGGVLSDRFDRRRVMLVADVARGLAVGAIAVLSLTGTLELWHMIALVAVYGAATAFFGPAFDAIVPDVLPASQLAAGELARPVRAADRAAARRPGARRLADRGRRRRLRRSRSTRPRSSSRPRRCWRCARPARRGGVRVDGSVAGDIRVGFALRPQARWLWATFATAAIAYLLFMGPTEVLLPFLVKNDLDGSAADLGLVFAAGGIGSVGCAVAHRPARPARRDITFMYVAWTLATLAVAGYGLATSVWQLMLASLVFNALETAGTIVWATAKQRHVPPALLGRVSSLDWLISIGLLPLSFALTGPVSAALGRRRRR